MLNRRVDPEVVKVNAAILRLLDEMETFGPDSPEYKTNLDHYERLDSLRKPKGRQRIDPNVMVAGGFGLLQVLTIVIYEQKHVMVSKALGFIGKTKQL